MGAARTRRTTSPRCFLHIPKSGGSSVHAALQEALPPGSLAPRRFDRTVFPDFDDFGLLRREARELVALEPEEVRSLGGYRAVSGHFSLPTLLQITDAASIATVLREPRARVLSLYMYWRTPGVADFWTPSRATEHARRPLAEFLSEPRLAPVVDNQVCRMLLYGDPRLGESDFAAQSDIRSLAADAIARLDAIGFVGVLELGETLWRGLEGLFEVELGPTKLNVTEELGDLYTRPEEQLLTSETLELIEERSAADALVYDHALAHAGLGARECKQLSDAAFAGELVKLGDLAGRSAVRATQQAGLIEALRGQAAQEQERAHAALLASEAQARAYEQTIQGHVATIQAHERTIKAHHETITANEQAIHARERTIETLGAQVGRHREDLGRNREELERLRRWLDAVHSSMSWKLTTPLRAAKHRIQGLPPVHPAAAEGTRDQSLLANWSVNQVWWFALALCTAIAATDAILSHVVLIAVLTAGPFCGAFTGRWTKTASVGIWAIVLAVPLGLADRIWDTWTQFVDLSTVAVVALLSTLAAMLIERRLQRRSEGLRVKP